jgi:hypothetical protein
MWDNRLDQIHLLLMHIQSTVVVHHHHHSTVVVHHTLLLHISLRDQEVRSSLYLVI